MLGLAAARRRTLARFVLAMSIDDDDDGSTHDDHTPLKHPGRTGRAGLNGSPDSLNPAINRWPWVLLGVFLGLLAVLFGSPSGVGASAASSAGSETTCGAVPTVPTGPTISTIRTITHHFASGNLFIIEFTVPVGIHPKSHNHAAVCTGFLGCLPFYLRECNRLGTRCYTTINRPRHAALTRRSLWFAITAE